MKNETAGRIIHVGRISINSFSVLSPCNAVAAPEIDKTVDWLVDCGTQNKLATNKDKPIESKITEVVKGVKSDCSKIPSPSVKETCFPANKAPAKTIIPNKAGIKARRIIFAP